MGTCAPGCRKKTTENERTTVNGNFSPDKILMIWAIINGGLVNLNARRNIVRVVDRWLVDVFPPAGKFVQARFRTITKATAHTDGK